MQYLENLLKYIQKREVSCVYSHENAICKADGQTILKFDCSGLIELWLKNSYPSALQDIYNYILKVRDTKKYDILRLYSFDFYDFFQNIKNNDTQNWQYVDINQSLMKGDVLALINPLRKRRWGHAAVVVEEVYRDDQKIIVKVIDSSENKHIQDSRADQIKGIGSGIIELYFNCGKINKISYDGENKKTRYVCVGRLKGIKA